MNSDIRPKYFSFQKFFISRGWVWFAGIGFILVFLVSRFHNLMVFPFFYDEATHIFLADQTLKGDIFIGLRETGKQTYIWLVAVSLYLQQNPIFATRVVSIIAGGITTGICYRFTNKLYPMRRIGYLAAIIYLVSPMAVLFNRLALSDTVLTMIIGAALLASVYLWEQGSIKWAIGLGTILGLAAFTKGYTIFFYPAPLVFWLVLGRKISWSNIIHLLAITYAVASMAWVLMVTIGWEIYRRELFIKSMVGDNNNVLTRFVNSSSLIIEWLGIYLTWPLITLLFFVGIKTFLKRDKVGIALIILIALPLLAFALTFTELHSRYFFPLIVPLSALISWGIDDLAQLFRVWLNKIISLPSIPTINLQLVVSFFIFIPSLLMSYHILFNPLQASLPTKDKFDYVINAQSVQGYEAVNRVIEEIALAHPDFIFLQHGLPNPLEVMIHVYLSQHVVKQQTQIFPIHNFDQITPQSLNQYASQSPTLTVHYDLITHNATSPLTYMQLWPLVNTAVPTYTTPVALYQWLLPPDFAIRWFQLGGDENPRIAWVATQAVITSKGGTLIDLTPFLEQKPQALQKILQDEKIEYILVTPSLVKHQEELFSPFITTDGETLRINQLPPDWQLAYAYPNLNCQWCLFQLKLPDQFTPIIFANAIALAGYDLSDHQVSAGDTLHLTLYWHSIADITEPLTIFIHLLDENGQLVGQIDEPPIFGLWPTNNWQPGTQLADRHSLPLDQTLPAGTYTIKIGLYNPATLERLPVELEKTPVTDNAVTLTEITIP